MAPQVLEELNVKGLEVVEKLPSDEHPGWPVVEEGGLGVMVDGDITQDLAEEGLARELVHRLQTMRKQAGFEIADRIETFYEGGDSIRRVMMGFGDYIRQETLSGTLTEGIPEEGAFVKSHTLEGSEMRLAVSRV
jgi:isoleucyl-tRNA synthetase